jgi:hypothetical protein
LGCPGALDLEGLQRLVEACTHVPPCKRVTAIGQAKFFQARDIDRYVERRKKYDLSGHQRERQAILDRIDDRITKERGIITCHIPQDTLPGDFMVAGKEEPLNRLVYASRTRISKEPVRHLCRNKRCCRFEHLVQEGHSVSSSRTACPGYIKFDSMYTYILVCQHNPPCRKVTDLGAFKSITQEEFDKDVSDLFTNQNI